MTWSSRPGILTLSDSELRSATRWAPEDVTLPAPEPVFEADSGAFDPPADSDEQDDLIEAIALANAERERQEQAERDAMLADAYAQGFEEGRTEGEIAEGARLRHALTMAESALEELRVGESRWTGAIEENICALAIAVAKHVIGRELEGDPSVVTDLVARALAEFPIDQPLRVRVNPSDLLTMSGLVPGGPVPVAADRNAQWIPDPMIAPGGCVVEGRERIVDGRVDAALERVYRRLTYTNA